MYKLLMLGKISVTDIIKEIFSLRQGDQSVTDYYTQLQSLWQELENFRPIPACACQVKCSCNLIPTMQSYRENECVIWFLRGLSDGVRSQIMLMEPLPPISKVLSLLIQQERQMQRYVLTVTRLVTLWTIATRNMDFPQITNEVVLIVLKMRVKLRKTLEACIL